MSRLVVLLLLVCLSACKSSFIAPEVAHEASSGPIEIMPSEDDPAVGPNGAPPFVLPSNVTRGFAIVSSNVLHVRCTVHLEDEWTYQVFMNSDNNSGTGPQGFDYVARGPGLDSFKWVVRSTQSDGSQLAGMGRVTGRFTGQWVGSRKQLNMQIPLTSMPGCHEKGRVRVLFYAMGDRELVPVDQVEMEL